MLPGTARRSIAVLPPVVSQRIATGEIVERPTSVVRELVENALDAGAQGITVEVRGAGLELIAVSDDGQGIPADELPLAFTRHATSKLATLDDLEAIQTLGFRGEALPSIAAVATVEITSATEESTRGGRLLLRDGEILEAGRVARTRGTSVLVRELFAGLPIRRGALPPARSESAMLLAVIRRYALAAPWVRFSLQLDGREVFRTAGLGEQSALVAVFGPAAGRLQPFGPQELGRLRVTGRLGDPGLTRADREGLVVIVNGRWVMPARWLQALEAAYRPLLRRGRHPVAVLWATVDPRQVNVTMHPAKLEARLADEDATLVALAEALRTALGRRPAEAHLLAPAAARPRQGRLPPLRRTLAEEHGGYGESPPDLARLRLLGQVLDTMLVGEEGGALYLIDQHRADERAIYEALTAGAPEVSLQELIEPVAIELRRESDARLEAALPDLERLGFRCERFGRRRFLVRAVPSGLPATAGPALVAALDEGPLDAPDWRDRLLVSVACHAAVRRRQPLTIGEMERLLRRLAACTLQTMCPHGSPIIARIGAMDLARHFEWR